MLLLYNNGDVREGGSGLVAGPDFKSGSEAVCPVSGVFDSHTPSPFYFYREAAMIRTNASRILEAAGISHTLREYDVSDGRIDGVSVAGKIGAAPEKVYKTLVTVGKTLGVLVFVIPVSCELDLKKAAAAAGDKFVEMIKARDLEPLTGYVHGGCSPVGMKKAYPTFVEETAALYDTIVVSAGRLGSQMELAPADLIRVTGASFADLI